uniref:Uncharacterized protein n=1 Tax=Arundo donax TaxID=35708 RepID=A0A0A9GSS0_ARUDO
MSIHKTDQFRFGANVQHESATPNHQFSAPEPLPGVSTRRPESCATSYFTFGFGE